MEDKEMHEHEEHIEKTCGCGHEHHHGHHHHEHDEECGCGHEHHHGHHHHDHDEECGCGHEHHHGHHHHDHDEECGCGHEHHHEHHDHDHDHEHEHEHGVPSLEMSFHDEAVIATVRCVIPGTYDEASEVLKSAMKKTAAEIEDNGGLIGHIKAFAKEENRSCMISIPEADDIQVKEAAAPSLHVECANIVFGLTAEKLETIVREYFKEWLA